MTTNKFFPSRGAARIFAQTNNLSVKDNGNSVAGERYYVVLPESAQDIPLVDKPPVKMYKLVTQEMTTQNNTKWEIGVTNKAIRPGNEMCSNQVLHCYSDPRLAVLFNPVHANIANPILMEIACSPIVNTDGLKHACKEQTPIKIIELPKITLNQRVAFAIKCALLVYKAVDFVTWAEKWLSGEDRTAYAAAYAARAAADAARAAAYAARAAAAAYAARAAADAARAAAADAAADAAAYAARAAADAARAADHKNIAKVFVEIIDFVMTNIT